jgi:polycomb protein EED
MRLWNTKTETCVLVLGGEKGHRDEVLSAVSEGIWRQFGAWSDIKLMEGVLFYFFVNQDFNLDGSKIVSGGMDHSLKIWDLECEAVKTVIANSFKVSEEDNKEKFVFDSSHRSLITLPQT